VLVDVHQVIDLLVEDIHIGQQVVVLFFSLDEGVLDFKNVSQSSCFLDGVEGLIDDLHVSLIVVDKFHFFLVVDNQLGQPLFQNASSVVLDGTYLSSFDPAAFVESRISQLSIELSESFVVVVLVLLIFHLEVQHQILTHVAGILTSLDVAS
jgi:hypothetical protein